MISAAFPYQKQRRRVLGREMAYVEAGEGDPIVRNPESPIDAGIELSGYLRDSARLHKSNELVASGIEKHVPDAPALFNLYGVCHYGSEAENHLVKLPRLVQVKGGKTYMGKSFMTHDWHSKR
jgi:hypothetical protein